MEETYNEKHTIYEIVILFLKSNNVEIFSTLLIKLSIKHSEKNIPSDSNYKVTNTNFI